MRGLSSTSSSTPRSDRGGQLMSLTRNRMARSSGWKRPPWSQLMPKRRRARASNRMRTGAKISARRRAFRIRLRSLGEGGSFGVGLSTVGLFYQGSYGGAKWVFTCAIICGGGYGMSNGNNGKPPPLPPDYFRELYTCVPLATGRPGRPLHPAQAILCLSSCS